MSLESPPQRLSIAGHLPPAFLHPREGGAHGGFLTSSSSSSPTADVKLDSISAVSSIIIITDAAESTTNLNNRQRTTTTTTDATKTTDHTRALQAAVVGNNHRDLQYAHDVTTKLTEL